MELVNHTPLAAELTLALVPDDPSARRGAITAKACFRVGPRGEVSLDPETPYGFFWEDEPTPLGVLPNDLPLDHAPGFEVMALAAAYASSGAAVTELNVRLTVGDVTEHLRVVGDRRWVEGPDGPDLSAPAPFVRMPLTWEQAFGGRAEVWLDSESTVEVQHPENPFGRGFDAASAAGGLAAVAHCEPTFPRLAYERLAPNLESPSDPVRSPADSPEPRCFAPMPSGVVLRARDWLGSSEEPTLTSASAIAAMNARAHPVCRFASAPLGSVVELTHAQPGGDFRFNLPTACPVMDFVLGSRRGSRPLTPRRLVLLPEERRFYLVYRHLFAIRLEEDDQERSARLRFE